MKEYEKQTASDELIFSADNITKEEYYKINNKKQTNQATEEDKINQIKYFLMYELGKS